MSTPTSFNGLSAEQALQRIREIRDQLLQEDVDRINAVRWSTMSAEQQSAWTKYRQELLDITRGGSPRFPYQVVWPTKPE